MRIGIDCRKIYDYHANKGAGIERYVYHLVRQLLKIGADHEFTLFFYSDISPETVHRIKGLQPRVRIVKFFKSASPIPLWDSHVKPSLIMRQAKLDWCIFPANAKPLFYFGKALLICHDSAIYINPEWFPDRQWLSTKIVVPRSLKSAELIVAVSQNTKNDLVKIFNLPESKIKVVYSGIAAKTEYLPDEIDSVKRKFGLERPFYLFLGTIEPRKNLEILIRAFANFVFSRDSRSDLVIAGDKGWKFKQFFQLLTKINERLPRPQIKYLGRISNRERNILLKSCLAMVYPSLYEGFGFPVAEAMALGAPVITSNNSSLKELGADGRAILIDPTNVAELTAALGRVAEDDVLRQSLIKKGREFAAQLSWERTARSILNLL